MLHKLSMSAYKLRLEQEGYEVEYIDSLDDRARIEIFICSLKSEKKYTIHTCLPSDYLLERRLNRSIQKQGFEWIKYDDPGFLTSRKNATDFFENRKRLHQTDFYIAQRKEHGVLLTPSGEPEGGKWTYDTENRKKLPKNFTIPKIHGFEKNELFKKCFKEVKKQFGSNPGHLSLEQEWVWPWTHEMAKQALQEFLKTRFELFGDYEDAIEKNENYLFHSLLSPALNTGLITPQEIIEHAENAYSKKSIPLNATEGFIRQILGWREFMHQVYQYKGCTQRTSNYWKHTRKIPTSFYTGETGIEPIDDAIKKLLDTSYLHHIERLMVLGSFFALCEFDPDEVYRWFMELFIDAYDWVMVPNVYGMSQFADGGLITTKPYICSSNYIFKMSNYKKPKAGENTWDVIWDGLFWRFMDKHRKTLVKNPRLSMLIKTFDKMPDEKKSKLLNAAEEYLRKL